MSAAHSPVAYRADIDGLRAVAVVAVILCHAGTPYLNGGFAGVDVFFVISGYLITQILVPATAGGEWRPIGEFYLRRVRRILPALFVMFGVVTIAALVLFVPSELERFGADLRLASVMLGNLAGWGNGNYFDAMTAQLPLLHVWSVAVEEQFYLAYPWLILAVARWMPGRRTLVLLLCALASLAFCLYCANRQYVANYYLAPTRGWELLAGALLVGVEWPLLARRWLRELLAALSLVALCACFVFLRQDDSWPNLTALLPCLATAGLLAAGRAGPTLSSRMLEWRPVVFTGLISYSLYLWHAPALTFFERFNIVPPSAWQLAALLAAVYAVSALSWAYIEEPVRRRRVLTDSRRLLWVVAATVLFLVVVATLLVRTHGLPQRFPAPLRAMIQGVDLHRDGARCMGLSVAQVTAGELCRFGPVEDRRPRVIAWGDSHAATLMPAFESVALSRGVSLDFAARAACRPLLGVTSELRADRHVPACEQFNEAMTSLVTKLAPDMVILAAHWSEPGDRFTSPALQARSGESIFRAGLERTVQRIASARTQVCIVLDVPELNYPIPHALLTARQRGLDTEFLRITRTELAARYGSTESDIRAVVAAFHQVVVDPKESLCRGERCDFGNATEVYYMDANHLTTAGARAVTRTIDGCLAALERR
ncbi:MAG TPA: acyltransferase family protein [Steroidobacteraceae bacterium]